MAKIAYTSKADNVVSGLPEINKVTAANMNEIKTSVNDLYDTLGGFAFYEDTATSATPINLSQDVWTDLTNNKAGSGTLTTYKPSYVTGDLWILQLAQLTLARYQWARLYWCAMIMTLPLDQQIPEWTQDCIFQILPRALNLLTI